MKKYIILTILVLLSTSLVSAEPWRDPTEAAPGGNTAAPINTSANSQVKSGGVFMGSLAVSGKSVFLNNIGIGVKNPTKKLDIAGDINFTGNLYKNGKPYVGNSLNQNIVNIGGNNGLVINQKTGSIGIGTSDPQAIFNINSNNDVTLNSKNNPLTIGNTTNVNLSFSKNIIQGRDNGNASTILIQPLGGNTILNKNGGNVGIGTDNPFGQLHIKSAVDNILTLQTSDNTWLYTNWLDKSGTRKIWMGLNRNLDRFSLGLENGVKSFNIYGGKVGIGITNPTVKLEVDGTVVADNFKIRGGGSVIPSKMISPFYSNTCPSGWVAANGNNGTPDLRGVFVRGIGTNSRGGSGSSLGSYQNDTDQRVKGTIRSFDRGHRYSSGAFYKDSPGDSRVRIYQAQADNWLINVKFDNSRVIRTSNESRPKNISLLYCMKK